MWKNTPLTKLLKLDYPITQAPMAGGATTPQLVAAVSNAGGLGSLGAGYMTAEKISKAIKEIRQLINKPFNINLFIPNEFAATEIQIKKAIDAVNHCSKEIDSNIETVFPPYSPSFAEQVDTLITEKIPVFSFTFGMLDAQLIEKFKRNNTFLIGTATTLAEAKQLEASGIDAIVVQGSEAGGHRGTFLSTLENSLVPLDELLMQCCKEITLPIIAAGGIMNGQRIAELLHAGASATQLGTAFLSCDEAGIDDEYKNSLLQQTKDTTVLTNVFSGKFARAVNNKFIHNMDNKLGTVLDYPMQNKLTKPLRQKAKEQKNSDYMSLWAGQGVHLSRKFSAENLLLALINEINASQNMETLNEQ